ncbi:MAG TPA: tRNA (adenosine(37)-N6)-threonylcarbamoyltransferase complex dimerization subunit type 1 TsaB [Candidatus Brocadiia bacterium]|nr:tRNA (adenosine(37)-N6)-threonylcarbamoyltransferase complex dimerization subunit type 1 TsaB [Candidatus Brocadiia bacterium]
MNILAIETSCPVGGVALIRDGVVVREIAFEKGMEHGRLLAAKADEICEAEGWRVERDVDVLAVSLGPGSFTGLRVGAAFARGVAFAASRPMVGVCSFDAMARNAPSDARFICTVLDAKRGDVYAAVYERQGAEIARLRGPEVARPTTVAAALPRPAVVLGDGSRADPGAFASPGIVISAPDLWPPRAGVIGLLAEPLARQGRFTPPEKIAPIYLRRPEAEEKRLAAK